MFPSIGSREGEGREGRVPPICWYRTENAVRWRCFLGACTSYRKKRLWQSRLLDSGQGLVANQVLDILGVTIAHAEVILVGVGVEVRGVLE